MKKTSQLNSKVAIPGKRKVKPDWSKGGVVDFSKPYSINATIPEGFYKETNPAVFEFTKEIDAEILEDLLKYKAKIDSDLQKEIQKMREEIGLTPGSQLKIHFKDEIDTED